MGGAERFREVTGDAGRPAAVGEVPNPARACHICGENESRMERDKMGLTLGPPSSYSYPSRTGPGTRGPAFPGSRVQLKRCREGARPAPAEKNRSTCSWLLPRLAPAPLAPVLPAHRLQGLCSLESRACRQQRGHSLPATLPLLVSTFCPCRAASSASVSLGACQGPSTLQLLSGR